jgi:3-dehydroquinate synthase class II
MASTSETGHAKNVTNFEDLISFCTGYGATYNPSKAGIKLPALNTQFTSAKNSLSSINTLLPPSTNAINGRDIVFSPLSKLITKIVNAVASSNVSKQVIADVKTIARKIQGKRGSDKLPDIADDPNTPEDESQKSISSSQMSFDNRIENMDKLIQLLASQAGYAPNETDLKVATLTTLLADMKTKNTAVITALTPLSNARIARNTILYATGTGLVDTAGEVKKYVKSVFGGTSPQYKQVSKLKFTKVGK